MCVSRLLVITFTLLSVLQFGVGGSEASFTPFVDPRVYQTSPGENDDENSAAGKQSVGEFFFHTANFFVNYSLMGIITDKFPFLVLDLRSCHKNQITSIFLRFSIFMFFYGIPALFANELLRQEQARLNEARKISVVNVNPTNIRPHSDTPEIRKYKKRFNSEILCAALWGKTGQPLPSPQTKTSFSRKTSLSLSFCVSFCIPNSCLCLGVNLLVGTENGLMLLDRSGQGKVYNLITRRRFLQMDVLEGLNVLVTISGWSNTGTRNFCSMHSHLRCFLLKKGPGDMSVFSIYFTCFTVSNSNKLEK